MVVSGVLLTKHAGDGYHYYTGTVHGVSVTFRPVLDAITGKPSEWKVLATVDGQEQLVAYGEQLRHSVRRAVRRLRPKEAGA